MNNDVDIVHSVCRSEINRLRGRLRNKRPPISLTGNKNSFCVEYESANGRRHFPRYHGTDDLELTLRQLDDDKISSMPPKFWKDMVLRVQYVIDVNRILRDDVAHLSGQHHCPLHTCKYSNGCCAQEYYTTPFIPTNHEECDRRCQDLEMEIETLKRERARLRQQNSSVHDLIRAIGQRQVMLQRDLRNSCQLEAENAMQRRLLSELSSERDALVSVLRDRDIGYAHLLQSIRRINRPGNRTEQLTQREKELEVLIERLLGMSHSLPDAKVAMTDVQSEGSAADKEMKP